MKVEEHVKKKLVWGEIWKEGGTGCKRKEKEGV